MFCFFFFKQKTAYEMRISDWSSDVCSSDLRADRLQAGARPAGGRRAPVGYEGSKVYRMDRLRKIENTVIGLEIRYLPHELGEQVTQEIGRASCRERVCQYV